MKNSLILTVLKVEGISEQFDCQIYQDDYLIKNLSLQNSQVSENLTEFIKKGVLTLLVKAEKSKQVFSVSLNAEAFPMEGITWLPLYSNSTEVLPSIPSLLPTTKMLISINPTSLLTPVQELNETDYSLFDLDQQKETENGKALKSTLEKYKKALTFVNEKNKDLRLKYCELQNRFELANEELCNEKIKENHEYFSTLAIQLEKQKLHSNNLQCINEENFKRIETLSLLLKFEQEKRQETEYQMTVLLEESKDYIKNTEKRIESYEAAIRSKDEEIFLLKSSKNAFCNIEKALESSKMGALLKQELETSISKLEESEASRQTLSKKLECSASYFSKELEELLRAPTESLIQKLEDSSAEVQRYRQKCAELENLLDDKYLDIKLGTEGENRASKLILELKEQLRIEREINENLMSNAREKAVREAEKLKGADEKFVEYLKSFSLDDRVQKVSDGTFSYNNKKVCVSIKNGMLVCRVGGGYAGIDQFIKGVLTEKEEVFSHKRSQTSVLSEKTCKEEIVRKNSDKKLKEIKPILAKENVDEVKVNKLSVKKSLTKSLTPNRESLYKRVFK